MLQSADATDMTKPGLKSRFYQFRQFLSDSESKAIRADHETTQRRKHIQDVFLIRGRPDQQVAVTDDAVFASRTRLASKKGVEHWEVDSREPLPMRKAVLAMMGARQPSLRSAVTDVRNGDRLCEALSRHHERICLEASVQPLVRQDADAFLVEHRLSDGNCLKSIVLRSREPRQLPATIRDLGLQPERSQSLGDRLREMSS